MKLINKSNVLQLYKFSGNFGPVELLRLSPKSSGFVAYLPHSVAEALNLSKDDHNLVCFVDDSGSHTMLVLFKDRDLSDLLKGEILSRRQQAEQMRQQLKSQLQPQEGVKQNDFVFDAEVEK